MLKRSVQITNAIEQQLWIERPNGYYARSIWSHDLSIDARADSSSVGFIFTGGAANQTRALSHLAWMKQNLVRLFTVLLSKLFSLKCPFAYLQTRLGAGIARYHNDPFFYDSIYNPGGGPEVGAPSPPW